MTASANGEYEEFAVDGGEEDEYEVEELVDDTPMRIYGRVFLGSIDAARNRAALVHANVGTTLALLGAGDERVESSNDEYGDSERLTRMLVELEDSVDEPLFTRLPALLATLQEALMDAENRDCNVLVHCMAGRSRSPSLVAAWLTVTRQYTLQQALDLIEMVRPWIEINDRFRRDLELFANVVRYVRQSEAPASVGWAAELTSHHLALLPRLDFGSSLVADILAHDKTVTMRLLSDVENDQNSDLLRVLQHSTVVATTASDQDATNRDAFAFLRIDRVDTGITLGSMTHEMVVKTGSTSKDHVLSVLQTFYPDVTLQTPLLVLSFTCIGSTRTK